MLITKCPLTLITVQTRHIICKFLHYQHFPAKKLKQLKLMNSLKFLGFTDAYLGILLQSLQASFKHVSIVNDPTPLHKFPKDPV